MRESCTYGSVRGALSNERPYRNLQRRSLLFLFGTSAAAWPMAARAQQQMPVVGILNSQAPAQDSVGQRAFRQGLTQVGFVEGRNVGFEYRWANNDLDRLPELAADLVRRKVSVIFASGGPNPALAAKAATTSIPIVFRSGVDPIALGLVASLNRPSGNLTGFTALNVQVGQKKLELMHELLPAGSPIALMVNPTNPSTEAQLKDAQEAAGVLRFDLQILHASTEREFDAVFSNLVQHRAGGLSIAADPFFSSRIEQLAALALRYRVPAIHQFPEFAAAGGLMSYGAERMESFRLAGVYTGRILKGEKPADLPVQQATRIELIINMKTAKALGITFPLTLLGRADEVIE
jgi:putative ABC transport system substrate-binding protein